MKKLHLFLFSFFSVFYFSQITNNELIGNWKVVKVLNNIGNKELKQGFQSSIFKFEQNSNFSLKPSHSNPLFSQIEMMTAQTKWKLIPTKNLIKIGTKEDNYSTMFIELERKKDKIIFHFKESNLDLEMVKL